DPEFRPHVWRQSRTRHRPHPRMPKIPETSADAQPLAFPIRSAWLQCRFSRRGGLMRTGGEILHGLPISVSSYAQAQSNTLCPQCSHLRKNKGERCLSVLIGNEDVKFNCHHCGFKGTERYDYDPDARPTRDKGLRTQKDRRGNSRTVRSFYR